MFGRCSLHYEMHLPIVEITTCVLRDMKTMYLQFKERFNRRLAIWRLVHRYEYLLEVEKLMEEYVMAKLLDGGSDEYMQAGRQELAGQQAKVRETTKMLNYLRSL